MSGNPYCRNCRGCEHLCYSCENLFAIRREEARQAEVEMAACPIPKGATVARMKDGEEWHGEVVSRCVHWTKKHEPVVVCEVAWDRMRNGGRRFSGGRSYRSFVQARRLRLLP